MIAKQLQIDYSKFNNLKSKTIKLKNKKNK